MKKVLVTGAYGQLGSEIKERHDQIKRYVFHFHDKDTLDLFDYSNLEKFLMGVQPDYIINCAAYTAVDKAEEDKELAMKLNGEVPGKLADASSKVGATLVHISTDYVFDGQNHVPYKEDDPTGPISYYGETKLVGEQNVLKNGGHAVVRTSWLYSGNGGNFVKTILRLGNERETLNVIFDQIGTPTYAGDLADALLTVIASNKKEQLSGVFHYSNEGVCSWYDFARAIMELAGLECAITPIETKDYPLPAPRPFYSILNKRKIKDTFQLQIPYWRESLKKYISKL